MFDDKLLSKSGATPKEKRTYRPQGKLARCLQSVDVLMGKYGHLDAKRQKVCGKKTTAERRKVMRAFVKKVHALGYKIEHVKNIGNRHIQAVVSAWESEGKAPSTIQTNLSHIRTLMSWVGKKGMVLPPQAYVKNPERVKRTYSAKALKGPEHNGVDVLPRFQIVQKKEPVLLVQLLLIYAFGLRQREAIAMKPRGADKVDYLDVAWGTKGGRDRTIKIRDQFQRDVLELAKTYAPTRKSSTTPKTYTIDRWQNRWQTVVSRAAGLNIENGCNPHGLRHDYAAKIYELMTGHKPPISGEVSKEEFNKEADQFGRQQLAEEMGHQRPQISNSYIGGSDCDYSDAPIREKSDKHKAGGSDEKPTEGKEAVSGEEEQPGSCPEERALDRTRGDTDPDG